MHPSYAFSSTNKTVLIQMQPGTGEHKDNIWWLSSFLRTHCCSEVAASARALQNYFQDLSQKINILYGISETITSKCLWKQQSTSLSCLAAASSSAKHLGRCTEETCLGQALSVFYKGVNLVQSSNSRKKRRPSKF